MDLATYLEGLPEAQQDALYDSPWTCRALLRALTPLGRLYVMRLLLPHAPVPQGEGSVRNAAETALSAPLPAMPQCKHVHVGPAALSVVFT